jgi:HK97 gp10 family phage protein
VSGNPGLRLEGGTELQNLLRELPRRVAAKGNRAAATAAAAPVLKAARRAAPKQFGFLKKALAKKVKSYKQSAGGVAAAIVGADRSAAYTVPPSASPRARGGRVRRAVPANYLHLVEQGHGGPRPAPPHPFLGPAFEASKDQAKAAAAEKFRQVVEKEAAKLGKR